MQNSTRFLVRPFISPSGHMAMGGGTGPILGANYNGVFNLMVRDDPRLLNDSGELSKTKGSSW
jgi:hypothetical protein